MVLLKSPSIRTTMRQPNIHKIASIAVALVLLAGCATRTSYLRLDPSLAQEVKSIDGFKYVPLARLCDVYGLGCKWDAVLKTATVSGKQGTIVLRAGSDRILANGAARRIERPVEFYGGAVFVPVSFARDEIAPMAAAPERYVPETSVPKAATPGRFTIRTVVLDTGHGGKDVGAIGRAYGTKEKDMALELSRKIRSILESNGIRVIMTRNDDSFLPLERRTEIANKSGADIFVSVHVNASTSRLMRGFECYYLSNATYDNARALEAFEDSSLKLSPNADAVRSSRLDKTLWDMSLTENRTESAELAGFICQSVGDSLVIQNRGVRRARFYVLKHTTIPSVLVEAGYISNRQEEMQLKDPAVLERLAEAVARGVLRYRSRYEETEGFTDV
jgi:N-acetylmuramoyl-L-alanine amidase